MMLFQGIALTGALFFLGMIFYAVYRDKLREAYALLWILVAVVTAGLAVVPSLLERLAALLGIKTPAFALLLCMTGGMLLLLFQITLIISAQNEKITRLMQEIALLKEKLSGRK